MGLYAMSLVDGEEPDEGPRERFAQAFEAPIDLVHLSRQTLGDSALEIELLRLFDHQAQQLALRLGPPFRQEEGQWRGDLAHTLKGSACAIGAFGVSRAAQAYEEGARTASSNLPAMFEDLEAVIATARAAIARLLDGSC
jgi:HPt (histidine-containing phosphotransfer) domain-containing protein